MRSEDNWIEPIIKVIVVISALLAISGIITVAHFVIKFW